MYMYCTVPLVYGTASPLSSVGRFQSMGVWLVATYPLEHGVLVQSVQVPLR
jgi:hypothetical protein